MQGRLVPHFPLVGADDHHYESFYLTASHPTDGTTYWIRHTVRKPARSDAVGSLWFTAFTPTSVRAGKVHGEPGAAPTAVWIGDRGEVRRDGATGRVEVDGLAASWDLRFESTEEPLEHLPYPWMYGGRLPRTKSTSPDPDLTVYGAVTVDGVTTTLDGWRGMLGHNWGSEHAHRWVWLRGAGFAEDPMAWLDLVIGRIKVGPVVVPWIANGMLSRRGVRKRIGGLGRRTTVRPFRDGVVVEVSGLRIEMDAPVLRSVGWEYADPAGGVHQVRNCSNAGMVLSVDGEKLTTMYGAVYELGVPEFDPAVAMQPFPDR